MNERSAAPSVRDAGTAERKLLTLLFADLSGYTRLTATHDPEDVLVTVGPLLQDLRRTAEDHGGYVPSVQGDGFMAVFGAPTSHADDPRRAAAAAIAMRAHVDVHRKRNPGVPDVHVGIASGEVLVTPQPDGLSVIGPAVNLAARLSDAAAPGEILVDESAAALTAEHAEFGPARVLSLHGLVGGVRAQPLVDLTADRSTRASPLAGRLEELAAIDATLADVMVQESSQVLLLVGEPGVGKSHLLSTWAAAHPEMRVARGAARAYGSALPLSALAEAISAAAADDESDPARDFLRLLPQQRTPGRAREPDEALLVAARRWLTQVARQEATALILEDLHWADDALLDAVVALHENPIPGQLLVIASSREPVPGLPYRAVPLLDPAEIRAIVEHRVGARPDPALLELLVDRSGGNALWLVECLALLRDRGQLVVSGDRASVHAPDISVEVPASIRMLISARLDSLGSERKLVLQRASVHPGDIAPDDWPGRASGIDELVDLRLVERSRGAVRIAHGVIREAIYGSMSRAARVDEHERILAGSPDPAARAYAALEVQRLDVAPDDGRRTQVADRALRAVTEHAQHLRTSHTKAARDVLVRSEDLCGQLDVLAPRAAAELLTELSEVLRDLDDGDRSRRTAERAVALAELTGDEELLVRAELALGEACLGVDNLTARGVAERLLASTTTPPTSRGRTWQLLANSRAYDDMAELHRCLESAFESHTAAGDDVGAADTARLLAYNLSLAADARFDRWLDAASALTASDHVRGQGELALIRALVAQARGAWEDSWRAAESAMELLDRAGLHLWLVDATAIAVEAATATARRAVLAGLTARLAALVDGHRARLQVTGLCANAPALALLGRDDEATQMLRRARALLPSVGRSEQAMVLVAEGRSAALLGRHDVAESAFAAAEALSDELGFNLARMAARLHRFEAQAAQGERLGLREDLLQLAEELHEAGAAPHAETARALAATVSR